MRFPLSLVLGLSTLAGACAPEIVSQPGDELPVQQPPGSTPSSGSAAMPPPISGGTLIVARDGTTAVAADPDRDKVYLVDIPKRKLLHTIDLSPGDEPGRLVEDANRRVHVALRGGKALVTIDLNKGTVLSRREVCGAPRGVAYDGDRGLLHVACATGELVSLPAQGGAVTRRLSLGPDLRDVVIQGHQLFVSRLKGAEVLELDASSDSGAVVGKMAPPTFVGTGFNSTGSTTIHTSPAVAWRMVGLPSGGVAMVHTRGLVEQVDTDSGGYGSGPCKGGIVNSTVSVLDGTDHPPAGALPQTTLPVDMAISPDGTQVAVVDAAGQSFIGFGNQVNLGPLSIFTDGTGDECDFLPSAMQVEQNQMTAVAFDGQSRVIAQSREPAALFVQGDSTPITLSSESRRDVGHDLFHGATFAVISCASCHPEGGDDGHVWNFSNAGPRRTQSIRGGILGTEPFHWSGDMMDLTHLTAEVMTKRMMGPQLTSEEVKSLGRWIDALPLLPAPKAANAVAVERGKALFNDAAVGCATCHSGEKLTNNQSVDVGTGGKFQVPSLLGVSYRAPFMHTGCATALRDRFGACGGGDAHGKTSHLSPQQLDDLTAFLGTL